jgi:hypothetical protein
VGLALARREENRVKVFENEVLRRILIPNRNKLEETT